MFTLIAVTKHKWNDKKLVRMKMKNFLLGCQIRKPNFLKFLTKELLKNARLTPLRFDYKTRHGNPKTT
jgi:hypothetical protein